MTPAISALVSKPASLPILSGHPQSVESVISKDAVKFSQ